MRKLTAVAVMSTALLFGGVASAATEHCPSGGTKTEGTHNGVVLSAGTQFCVKASNEATTVLVADGSKSLIEYVLGAGIVNGQGKAHDVSYYVVYPATTTTTEVPPSDTTSTTTSPTTPTTEPPSSSTTVVATTTPAPERPRCRSQTLLRRLVPHLPPLHRPSFRKRVARTGHWPQSAVC
jgi:hypothetical protein